MQGTKASGLKTVTQKFARAEALRFGPMALCTRATGKMAKPTARGDSFTLMAMSMMGTGRMIKLMDMVFTRT